MAADWGEFEPENEQTKPQMRRMGEFFSLDKSEKDGITPETARTKPKMRKVC
jgi:hypothetical protein